MAKAVFAIVVFVLCVVAINKLVPGLLPSILDALITVLTGAKTNL